MSYQYDWIDGERVEKNVAAAYRGWAEEFKAETGCDMYVSSGTRTEAEQARGRADYLAGRTTVKWAKPEESSHCEIGPAGPRALDIRDSGSDAGVTVKGTYRWNVAVRLGRKYGFTWGGWGVPDYEGWHFENHAVTVGRYPKPAGGGSKIPVPATTIEEHDMDIPYVYNKSPYDRVYAINPLTGKKRPLSKAEWEASKLTGARAWEATQAQVDEIPNA